MKINWTSQDSLVLCNPSYSVDRQKNYRQLLEAASSLSGHLWLSTSGSTSYKWVGLSKQALLASAQAVNQHLQAAAADRWVTALPDFHVGGLGIWARSYLSGASVFNFKAAHGGKWQPAVFWDFLDQVKGTLTALVPTQLYDFVQLGKPAPRSLRAVIIGGGQLMPDLYQKAVSLGWPVMPSYGLTECASQVATAPLGCWENGGAPRLQILSHIQVKEKEGRLLFKGPSLLSAYAYFDAGKISLSDPKVEEWLASEDRGEVKGDFLTVFGRLDACLKIGGENVDLARLDAHLQSIALQLGCREDFALAALPDPRLGHMLCLAVAQGTSSVMQTVIERFQQTVLPFERIREIVYLPLIPRSALCKVLKNELLAAVNEARN